MPSCEVRRSNRSTAWYGCQRQRLQRRLFLSEGLVDDEPTAARREALVQIKEVNAARNPAVRIVRIDHDRDIDLRQGRERSRLEKPHACRGESLCMTAVGRA